ncbi:dihydrolipoyllysine-residue acetyltransferase [Chromatiales bacterium (ex Bugula neritina AB1)]|nr:dihydrolipoyllysine-residue acetyltransferase [Chromatiales bacterium (ex Bugula neritina AB1)]
MANSIEIRVPDLGDFDTIEIIEVLVTAGDSIEADQSLITLESDKASMEIPSTHAGTIGDIVVNVGDKVSKGDLIATLAAADEDATAAPAPVSDTPPVVESKPDITATTSVPVVVPDIGEFEEIEVIEMLVQTGDTVSLDQSLITLESDKASMEIPSTAAGVVESINVEIGTRLSKGDTILHIASSGSNSEPNVGIPASASAAPAAEAPAAPVTQAAPSKPQNKPQPTDSPTHKIADESYRKAHASPAIRKFARQLGVNLALVNGTGRKNRILKEDIELFVKSAMTSTGAAYGSAGQQSTGGAIPSIPEVDFSKFGDVERVEMTRINVLTAENLHRAWLNLPMVTHHDEADITEMEAFRTSIKKEAADRDIRVTGLVFHVKALGATLKEFPRFNSSLSADGQSVFYKKYFNIGIAVDTPAGLVVPVLTDVNAKSIYQLSEEMTDLSTRARAKKLKPAEMQGASMTISSLGGIGGTAFTPIVNPPEVAILGITRAKMQPVWNGNEFEPRLMCPLDLTYDHRVIDGADGARFMAHYCKVIGDIRKMLLY